MVSRKHVEDAWHNGNYLLTDNNSFNGTLVNGQRISAQTPIYHDDEIQLGLGGPVMRFNSPLRIAPKGASRAGRPGRSRQSDCQCIRSGRIGRFKNNGRECGQYIAESIAR